MATDAELIPWKLQPTVYRLRGKELKKFRSNAAAELTVDVGEQDKEKKKTYDMEVPLNVSQDDAVRHDSLLGHN